MSFLPEELFSVTPQRWVVRRYYDGRVDILDNQSNQQGLKMSKIQEITSFMRDDVNDMNKQAEELHKVAMEVRGHFGTVMSACRDQLTQAQKDLMELQAAMGLSSNLPPTS